MVQAGQYIGGIVRVLYYWAYQPDSGTALSKNRIIDQTAGLLITTDAFSGRQNPTFTLTDSAAVFEITHAIYVSINTLLDSTIIRSDTTTCNSSILGYRKLSVMNMFPPDNPISSSMPSIEMCGGKMTYYKVSPTSTTHQRVSLYDKNSRLEKLIIRICCEKNLSVTDQYGTVRFCDVVPDSLKSPLEDIRISKDSLWVYNSYISSKADAITLKSNSSAAVRLDSANIIVEEMDTTGLGLSPGSSMEVAWGANSGLTPFFIWNTESIGNNEFTLKKRSFLPQGSEPLSFKQAGDSSQIFKCSIGYCLLPECRPLYPTYFKGKLKLFFSNNQMVTVKLYSDDLRTPVRASVRRGSIATSKNTAIAVFSIDGRKISSMDQLKRMNGVLVVLLQSGKCKKLLVVPERKTRSLQHRNRGPSRNACSLSVLAVPEHASSYWQVPHQTPQEVVN
jgi:hypothetical protein